MSYSAFKLQVAAADGKSIRNTITQPSHGFVAGNVLRYVFTPESAQGFTLAIADNPENAEVVGVVESVTDDSQFVLVYSGEIDLSTLTDLVDTDGVYFLSHRTKGELTTSPPTTGGSVIKPVLTRISDEKAIVTNYLGTVIGGQSTVSLDEIQPAGVIAPFVGDTSTIPNNWALCDGSLYDRYKYADLFQKIGTKYGFRQDIIVSPSVDGVSITLDSSLVGGKVVTTREVNGSVITIEGTISSFSSAENKLSVDVDSYTQSGVGAGDKSISFPANPSYEFAVNNSLAIFNSSGSRVFQNAIPIVTSENITHLQVPDLRGRTILGSTDSLTEAVSFTYQLGQVGGDEEVALFTSNLPPHNHSMTDVSINGQTNVSLQGDIRLRNTINLQSTTGLRTESHSHYLVNGREAGDGGVPEESGIWRTANRNLTIQASDGAGAGTDGDNNNFEYSLTGTTDPAVAGKSSSENPRVVGDLQIADTSLVNTLSIQNGGINAEIVGETAIVGQGQPFGNLQPYMALNWIIRLTAYQKAALVDLDVSTVTTFSAAVTFDGGMTANRIDVSGESGFSGGVTFGADGVDIIGRLDVAGGITTSTINVTGYAEFDSGVTLDSTLNVSGISRLMGGLTSSSLDVIGLANFGEISGITLDVSGSSTLAGLTASTLDITGVADFAGGVTASVLDVVGRADFASGVTIDGRLDLVGVGDFAGGVTASILDVTGSMRANGGLTSSRLDVTGVSDFAGGVTASSLDVSGISRLTALTMIGTGVSTLKGVTATSMDVTGSMRANGSLLITGSNAPGTTNSPGTTGQIEWDSTHVYVCVGTDEWRRAELSTW